MSSVSCYYCQFLWIGNRFRRRRRHRFLIILLYAILGAQLFGCNGISFGRRWSVRKRFLCDKTLAFLKTEIRFLNNYYRVIIMKRNCSLNNYVMIACINSFKFHTYNSILIIVGIRRKFIHLTTQFDIVYCILNYFKPIVPFYCVRSLINKLSCFNLGTAWVCCQDCRLTIKTIDRETFY